MQYRAQNGLSLNFFSGGKVPPLVFLHAFPLSSQMWQPQMAFYPERALVYVDMRGFSAGSDAAPDIELMADDVAELLNLTPTPLRPPAVLCGLSMGGYVALAFARRHPEKLAGLILADTRAEADTPEGKANRETAIAFVKSHTPKEFIEGMIPRLLSPKTLANQPAVKETVIDIASRQSSEAIVAALQALRDRPDASPSLANIKVPTLVIVGEDDVLTPPAVAKSLAERIAGASLVTIPEAGHLSNLEQPDKFNDAVKAFLKTV
jgi:pimeloyl-ACP methyl ester carboxylesterase